MIVGIDAVLSFYKFIENQQKIVFLKLYIFHCYFTGIAWKKKSGFSVLSLCLTCFENIYM